MIFDFTSVHDTSDSIPFCEGGIDSRHTHTQHMHVNIHAVSCRIHIPSVDSLGSIHITWWIPRMANMCWSSKSNTILPKNTKKRHPASPKLHTSVGPQRKKTSGGLERSELGLEVRWFDGSIGWLDGWISRFIPHEYIYLSNLNILIYLQSYESDLDALPCWDIKPCFLTVALDNLMGLGKPGSRHGTTASQEPFTRQFPSTWWSYPKPTQTSLPGHCRSETVVTWPHFWSAMFPGALRFWRDGEIINWWVKRWAMAKHWTAHAAEMT